MEIDWGTLGALTLDGLGTTLMNTLGTLLVGFLITLAIILVFGKLGVYRRTPRTPYHWLVKLWIPYLLVVGLIFSFKLGLLRSGHAVLSQVNASTVDAIYDTAVSPYLGSEENKRTFLTTLQHTAGSAQDLNEALTNAIKAGIHQHPDSELSMGRKVTNLVADKLIGRYGEDITAAVVYGVYLKSEDYLSAHSNGEPMEYAEFKEGFDQLMEIDVARMERSIKTNLGGLTQGLIDNQYRHFRNGALALAALLMLLPLLEWAIYRFIMRSRARPEALDSGEGPLEPPVARVT